MRQSEFSRGWKPLAVALALVAAACGGQDGPAPAPAAPAAPPPPAGSGPRAAVGGISWAEPAGWQSLGAQGMRAASYAIPTEEGGEVAEMAVFFFGPGQGGDTEANIQRWIGQFKGAGGGPAEEVRRGARAINGLQVTTLEAKGAYAGAGGPMMGGGEAQPGYMMLAAIVDGPQAPVFFKLTGPEAVVEAARARFDALLESLRLEANA